MSEITIATNVDDFTRDVRAFQFATAAEARELVRKTAARVLGRVVPRMPVASGRARAGWRGAGEALGIEVPESEASEPGDSDFIDSLNDIDFPMVTAVNAVHSNGYPYPVALEYGWSKQAPLGMVRISILEVSTEEDLAQDFMARARAIWESIKPAERFMKQRELLVEVFRS